jgi:hypothetical protein
MNIQQNNSINHTYIPYIHDITNFKLKSKFKKATREEREEIMIVQYLLYRIKSKYINIQKLIVFFSTLPSFVYVYMYMYISSVFERKEKHDSKVS